MSVRGRVFGFLSTLAVIGSSPTWGEPNAEWSPNAVNATVIPGVNRSFSFVLTANAPIPSTIAIIPKGGLASNVSVLPSLIGPLAAGSTTTVSVNVDLPSGAAFGTTWEAVFLVKDGVCALGSAQSTSSYCSDDDSSAAPPFHLKLRAEPFADSTFYSQIPDPRALGFYLPNSSFATIFGSKNPDGTPATIQGVTFQSANQPNSLVLLDSLGRPAHFVLRTGDTLDLTYIDASTFSVLATSGTTGQTVTQTLTLPTTPVPAASPAVASPVSNAPNLVPNAAAASTAPVPVATIAVSVNDPTGPVSGATVWANITITGTFNGYSLPLVETSPGLYTAQFDNVNDPLLGSGFTSACSAWTSPFNKATKTPSAICKEIKPTLNEILNSSACNIFAEFGEGAIAECEAATAGLLELCTAIQVTNTSSSSSLCRSIESVVNIFSPTGVTIIATASSNGRSGKAPPTDVAANVQNVEMTIQLPGCELVPPSGVVVQLTINPGPPIWTAPTDLTLSPDPNHPNMYLLTFAGNTSAANTVSVGIPGSVTWTAPVIPAGSGAITLNIAADGTISGSEVDTSGGFTSTWVFSGKIGLLACP